MALSSCLFTWQVRQPLCVPVLVEGSGTHHGPRSSSWAEGVFLPSAGDVLLLDHHLHAKRAAQTFHHLDKLATFSYS